MTASAHSGDRRRAGERLGAVWRVSLDALLTMDEQGTIVDANPAAAVIFGPVDALIGRSPADTIVPPGLRAAHTRGLARYLATRQSTILGRRVEVTAMRLDGTEFPAELTIVPLSEEGRVLFIGTVRDITERRRVERALRESEERFRELAENIQEVFWMTDPAKSRVLYVSPGYERIMGRSCQSVYADPASWLECVHEDDRARVRQSVPAQITGEFDEIYRVVRPDGTVRWVHDRAFPVCDANGQVVRIVGVAEDITGRKALEEQLLQSQKMEAIGQLAGGIAHDFNNLLLVIGGHAALLAAADLPAALGESAREIVEASERAAGLTQQLLAFSRRQAIQPRPLDLNELVARLARMLQRMLGGQVRLTLNLHALPLTVLADSGLLEQVLMNLVVNARDAMPDGGEVVIETGERTLKKGEALPAGMAPGRHAAVRVSDTGSGISAEHLPRIFEPFFTTKEVGRGTGLGLAIVFGAVAQHGGAVRVRSDVGRGSTFEVLLPLMAAPAHAG